MAFLGMLAVDILNFIRKGQRVALRACSLQLM